MVFVTRGGQVTEQQPWGLAKVTNYLWAFVDLVIAFFTTLIPGLSASDKSGSNFRQGGSSRNGGGGGGGGGGFFGGGGGGGGPRGPPKPPPRRNVYGLSDYRAPPGPPSCSSCQ